LIHVVIITFFKTLSLNIIFIQLTCFGEHVESNFNWIKHCIQSHVVIQGIYN